jgi:threonine dehydrogenase-like Zn-dependent dehydrogenase
VTPGEAGSAEVAEVDDPRPDSGDLLVQGLAVGVCGTDREIAEGRYGTAPAGRDHLVLGHESLGRVLDAPAACEFEAGDLVVGIVRRPDPVPCGACARGEWDMCRNGRYRERGIKELDGYASEQWTVATDFAIGVDRSLGLCGVLTEPTSVVAKAWEQIERVGNRSWFDPQRALVIGAGPIGLLAALLGVQRGLDVHVLDRVTDGPKPQLISDLGATYHHESLDAAVQAAEPDVIVEATGVGSLVFDAMGASASYGVLCLTGVSSPGRQISIDAGELNREVVLENDAIIGSVNANRRHYAAAAAALARADRDWLRRLITHLVPLDQAATALGRGDDDVKVVIGLTDEVASW